jgi:CRP-like cAMP-binding protein
LYVLIDGDAEVVSESGDVTLFNINPGDFFGEISCLFGVPATARVKVPSR